MMGREAGMAPRYVQAARDLVLARLGARRRPPEEQDALIRTMETRTDSQTRYGDLAAEAALREKQRRSSARRRQNICMEEKDHR